jgi:DNA-binding transcriptional MocR family regulator
MIDLRHNYPLLDQQVEVFSQYLQRLSADMDQQMLTLPPWGGHIADREVAKRWMKSSPHQQVLICSGGNQALSILAVALQLTGKVVITEDFTYSAFSALAVELGIRLVSCKTDEHGVVPSVLHELCNQHDVAALFVQPTIHNPTCVTMPLKRRLAVVEVIEKHQITVIEDDAYRFLHDSPPPRFADLTPNNTIYIASLSKVFSPTLKVAYLLMPDRFVAQIENIIRLTSSGPSGILVKLASLMINDGVIDEMILAKRVQANKRQQIIRAELGDLKWASHPNSFHFWLQLPEFCSAGPIQKQLLSQGVDFCSGNEFAATGTDGDGFLRISLGAEGDTLLLRKGISLIKHAIDEASQAVEIAKLTHS